MKFLVLLSTLLIFNQAKHYIVKTNKKRDEKKGQDYDIEGELARLQSEKILYSVKEMHTDSVVSFESFRTLKLSKSESCRALKFYYYFLNFRALNLSYDLLHLNTIRDKNNRGI